MTQRLFWSTAAAVLLVGTSVTAGAQTLVSSMSPQEFFSQLGGIAPRSGNNSLERVFNFKPTPAPDAATARCEVGNKSLRVDVEPTFPDDSAQRPKLDLNIRFISGSDRIDPVSQSLLNNLALGLNMPGITNGEFAIAGHSDRQGDETQDGRIKNRQLSCARAIAVREYLVQQGVGRGRLAAYGFGSARPLVPNVVKSDINRRVEIRRAN